MKFKLRHKQSFSKDISKNETKQRNAAKSILIPILPLPEHKHGKSSALGYHQQQASTEQKTNKHKQDDETTLLSKETRQPSGLSRSSSTSIGGLSRKASGLLTRSASTSLMLSKAKRRSPKESSTPPQQEKSFLQTVSKDYLQTDFKNEPLLSQHQEIDKYVVRNNAACYAQTLTRNEGDVPGDAQALAYGQHQNHVATNTSTISGPFLSSTSQPELPTIRNMDNFTASESSSSSSSVNSSYTSGQTGLSTSITSVPISMTSRSSTIASKPARTPYPKYYPDNTNSTKRFQTNQHNCSHNINYSGIQPAAPFSSNQSVNNNSNDTINVTSNQFNHNVLPPKKVSSAVTQTLNSDYLDYNVDHNSNNKPYIITTNDSHAASACTLITPTIHPSSVERKEENSNPQNRRLKTMRSYSTSSLLDSPLIKSVLFEIDNTHNPDNNFSSLYFHDSKTPNTAILEANTNGNTLKSKKISDCVSQKNPKHSLLLNAPLVSVSNGVGLRRELDKPTKSQPMAADNTTKSEQSCVEPNIHIGNFYKSFDLSAIPAQASNTNATTVTTHNNNKNNNNNNNHNNNTGHHPHHQQLVPFSVVNTFRCAREIASVSSFGGSSSHEDEYHNKAATAVNEIKKERQNDSEEDDCQSIGSQNNHSTPRTSSSTTVITSLEVPPTLSPITCDNTIFPNDSQIYCKPTCNTTAMGEDAISPQTELHSDTKKATNAPERQVYNPKRLSRSASMSSIHGPPQSKAYRLDGSRFVHHKADEYCRNNEVKVFSVQTATVSHSPKLGYNKLRESMAAETASIITCSTQVVSPQLLSDSLFPLVPKTPSQYQQFHNDENDNGTSVDIVNDTSDNILLNFESKSNNNQNGIGSTARHSQPSNHLTSNPKPPRLMFRSVTDPGLLLFQNKSKSENTLALMQSVSPLETLAVQTLNQQHAMVRSKPKAGTPVVEPLATPATISSKPTQSLEKKDTTRVSKKRALKKTKLPNEYPALWFDTDSDDEFPSLTANNLYLFDVTGDGNCLFRAVSDQYYGDGGLAHFKVRAMTVDYMEAHPDEFDLFMLDETLKEHLDRMRKSGTYGDQAEIVAFARAANVNVAIHQLDTDPLFIQPDGGLDIKGNTETPKKTLHIAYHRWEHYNSVRNVDGPHTGPPQIVIRLQTASENYAKDSSKPTVATDQEPEKKVQDEQDKKRTLEPLAFKASEENLQTQLADKVNVKQDPKVEYKIQHKDDVLKRLQTPPPLLNVLFGEKEKKEHKKSSTRSSKRPNEGHGDSTASKSHKVQSFGDVGKISGTRAKNVSARRLSISSIDLDKPLPPLPPEAKRRLSLDSNSTFVSKNIKIADTITIISPLSRPVEHNFSFRNQTHVLDRRPKLEPAANAGEAPSLISKVLDNDKKTKAGGNLDTLTIPPRKSSLNNSHSLATEGWSKPRPANVTLLPAKQQYTCTIDKASTKPERRIPIRPPDIANDTSSRTTRVTKPWNMYAHGVDRTPFQQQQLHNIPVKRPINYEDQKEKIKRNEQRINGNNNDSNGNNNTIKVLGV